MKNENSDRVSVGTKLLSSSVVGGILLGGVVLPAEFGIDPTGIGKVTGLNQLAETTPYVRNQDFGETLVFNVEDYDSTAETITESIKGLVKLEDLPFKSETILVEIEDLGEVEHKFIMKEDMAFVYSWKVVDPKGDGVYYDFHGHPQAADVGNFPEGFELAYSKSEGASQNGSFTAPFSGLHGFYFMNLEEGPITVELTISGFYESHQEVYRAVDGKVTKRLDL